ncbi:MAG: hypothetical protein Q9220_001880 [cf. Caloplaca sp. 1 TL-2023]
MAGPNGRRASEGASTTKYAGTQTLYNNWTENSTNKRPGQSLLHLSPISASDSANEPAPRNHVHSTSSNSAMMDLIRHDKNMVEQEMRTSELQIITLLLETKTSPLERPFAKLQDVFDPVEKIKALIQSQERSIRGNEQYNEKYVYYLGSGTSDNIDSNIEMHQERKKSVLIERARLHYAAQAQLTSEYRIHEAAEAFLSLVKESIARNRANIRTCMNRLEKAYEAVHEAVALLMLSEKYGLPPLGMLKLIRREGKVYRSREVRGRGIHGVAIRTVILAMVLILSIYLGSGSLDE